MSRDRRVRDLYERVKSISERDAFQSVIKGEADPYLLADLRERFWDGRGEKPWQVIELNRRITEIRDNRRGIREVIIVMEPATAAAFLSALASVSTIAKNVRDWLRTDQAPNEQTVLKQANEAGTALASDTEARDLVLKISDQVFNPIDGRIKRARKKLEEVLGDPYLPKERRRTVMDECDESICEALQDLKRYNNGVLPEHLKGFWDEHGCSGRA